MSFADETAASLVEDAEVDEAMAELMFARYKLGHLAHDGDVTLAGLLTFSSSAARRATAPSIGAGGLSKAGAAALHHARGLPFPSRSGQDWRGTFVFAGIGRWRLVCSGASSPTIARASL